MAEYQVNPITVNGVVEEIAAAYSGLLKQVDTLKSLRTELSAKWEGQANLAYNQVFDNDIRLLESYLTLLRDYGNALHDNALEYVATEDENVQKLQNTVQ